MKKVSQTSMYKIMCIIWNHVFWLCIAKDLLLISALVTFKYMFIGSGVKDHSFIDYVLLDNSIKSGLPVV